MPQRDSHRILRPSVDVEGTGTPLCPARRTDRRLLLRSSLPQVVSRRTLPETSRNMDRWSESDASIYGPRTVSIVRNPAGRFGQPIICFDASTRILQFPCFFHFARKAKAVKQVSRDAHVIGKRIIRPGKWNNHVADEVRGRLHREPSLLENAETASKRFLLPVFACRYLGGCQQKARKPVRMRPGGKNVDPIVLRLRGRSDLRGDASISKLPSNFLQF